MPLANLNNRERRTKRTHEAQPRASGETEQTINDFIIAEIKKCKFLIADFTHQKNGTYFEAGYALGRGKKVIYTCHADDFENLHFDVSNFPVLKYHSPEELRTMLKSKMEAYIND